MCVPPSAHNEIMEQTDVNQSWHYVCMYVWHRGFAIICSQTWQWLFFAFHNTQNLTWEFARYEAIMKSHTISDVKKALHTNFLHFTLRPYSFSTTPILRMIFFCKHDVQTHSSLSPHCHWHSNLLPISAPLSSTHSTCHPSPSTHSWLVAIQWKGLRGMT